MKLIKSYYKIESDIDSDKILKNIELYGRTCYKSEDKITKKSAREFVAMLIRRGHESVLEHEKISVRFICDRGVTHEIVRHRIASYSQESTRYCNYGNDEDITFIVPNWFDFEEITNSDILVPSTNPMHIWLRSMHRAEIDYNKLINEGWIPQQARSVLPNSLKTEIVMTANLREWREVFRQRTAKTAHPQMRELMCPLLDELKIKLPIIFDDINY